VEWVDELLVHMREQGHERIEATQAAAAEWTGHVQEVAAQTLYPTADSWYMGANIPGKPRVFMPNLDFVGPYRAKCDDIAASDYPGFAFSGSGARAPA